MINDTLKRSSRIRHLFPSNHQQSASPSPSPQLFSTNDGKQCEQNFPILVLSETASTTTTSDGSSVTRGSRKYTVVPLALDDDKVELNIVLNALIVYNKNRFLS